MRPLHLLAVIMAAAAPAQAQTPDFDAVVVAPNSHLVLFENDEIRVLRVEVAPGTTEPVHSHAWPSVMYFEQPQPITYITYKLVNGRPVETERFDAPALEVSQTIKVEPESLHAVKNRGSKPFVAVRIELKKGDPVETDSEQP